MQYSNSANVEAQGAFVRTTKVTTLLKKILQTFTFLLLLGNASADCQSTQWITLNNFNWAYQIDAACEVLNPGDPFSVMLYLDIPPEKPCTAVRFDIPSSESISPQSASNHTLPVSSFLGTSSELITSFTNNQNLNSWRISQEKKEARFGNQHVLTLNFNVGENPLTTSDLRNIFDGGIVLVENIDMKRMDMPSPDIVLKAFPNPFTDRLQIEVPQKEKLKFRIKDMQGNVVMQGTRNGSTELDTRMLNPGLYFMEIQLNAETQAKTFKMIKK